jgi:hypothetical protein
MAEAGQDVLDLPQVSDELERSVELVCEQLAQLEAWGLLLTGSEEGLPPILLNAGRQYLRARGDVEQAVLSFLPKTLDDLIARRAMLEAGSILVDEFAYQIVRGGAVEHAQEIVPPAFADAVTTRLAVDLFAAAVALLARLTNDMPAGCVAEEIVAVHLIEEAKTSLVFARDEGTLERAVATAAAAELNSLFEVFQDDDVLRLFDMREPADAAVADEDPVVRQMGIADQRMEAWFEPFWGLPATGHLAARTDRPEVLSALPDRLIHVVAPDAMLAPGTGAGEFRVCIRIWEDEFAQRAEYDQLPPTWTYYVDAPTAYEAERGALNQFPRGAAISPGFDEEGMFDASEIARFSIDVQRVGLNQDVKASNGGFHVVGTIQLDEALLPRLAGSLRAIFPAAVVAHDSSNQYLAVSVNAESHEEAEADLDDALRNFASATGLADEAVVQHLSCGHGTRDETQLLTEIERFHPVRLDDDDR